ncbi:DMT family transporter [Nisaea sp.]|uniref:DMT family transporter n=1 Tax=Nisaea sp. TaxID=2024842 RepID=UPI003B52F4C0
MSYIHSLKLYSARLPAPVRGVLLMALAAAMFVCMHAIIRDLGKNEGLHPFEIAFFRSFLGLFVLAPLLIRQRFRPLHTTNMKLLFLRGAVNAAAMLMFFYGLTITPLAEATALGFTAPLFATLLAMLFLGEVVRLRRWVAILIGFAGTLVIIRPGVVDVGLGPLLILAATVVWSFALIIIKFLTRTESSVTITVYASIFLSPFTLAAAAFFWRWPTLEEAAWLCLIALFGTIAQTAMNQSLKLADASVVLPVDFSKLIWAAFIGFVIFEELPDIYTWIGGAMIFVSTTYIAVRESRLKKQAAKAAA